MKKDYLRHFFPTYTGLSAVEGAYHHHLGLLHLFKDLFRDKYGQKSRKIIPKRKEKKKDPWAGTRVCIRADAPACSPYTW